MAHIKLDVLADNGYAILGDGPAIPPEEWERLEYVDWKSGGDTNFAPLASAKGEMECAGFWDHGKPDKDGIWTSNREIAPTLCKYVEAVGARYGRVRVIKLNGFVQAGPAFFDIPKVINGCSDLMVEAFGDAGRHARSAVGVYRLPLNFAVEVDAVVELA